MTKDRILPLTLALAAAASLIAGGAVAQDAGTGPDREGPSFESLDLDGDGQISRAEFDAQRGARFAQADADGNGMLDQAEMQAMMTARMEAEIAARVARMIARFDADGDGALSMAEMPDPRRAGAMFERSDADGSGAMSQDEYGAARDGMQHRKGRMGHHRHMHHHGSGKQGGMGRSCADQT